MWSAYITILFYSTRPIVTTTTTGVPTVVVTVFFYFVLLSFLRLLGVSVPLSWYTFPIRCSVLRELQYLVYPLSIVGYAPFFSGVFAPWFYLVGT